MDCYTTAELQNDREPPIRGGTQGCHLNWRLSPCFGPVCQLGVKWPSIGVDPQLEFSISVWPLIGFTHSGWKCQSRVNWFPVHEIESCLHSVWRREQRSQKLFSVWTDFHHKSGSLGPLISNSLKGQGLVGHNCFRPTSPTSIEL